MATNLAHATTSADHLTNESANDNGIGDHAQSRMIRVNWHGEYHFPSASWLVPDLIPERAVGLFIGESGAGKTMASVDLAVSLAVGKPFLTKQTKRGGTLYVPAEAPETIYERLEAACRGLGPDADEKFPFLDLDELPIAVTCENLNLADNSDVDRVIQTAGHVSRTMEAKHGLPLRLIVVDTMMAAFAVDDWNGQSETTKAMMVLARIRDETRATVIGIHHHGKDVSRGAAGSFALKANADFCVSIFVKASASGEVKERWTNITKQRRGKEGWGCKFELIDIEIGEDEDGRPARSAYVMPLEETTSARNENSATILLMALQAALEDGFGEPRPGSSYILAVAKNDLRQMFVDRYKASSIDATDAKEAARKAFDRASKQAVHKGTIETGNWDDRDWFWPAEDLSAPF
jgi:hypothetical protein